MKYFHVWTIALTVAISGQSIALDAPPVRGSQKTVKNHTTCPSQDFSEFLKMFSESVVIQKAFTKYPLVKQQLDLAADPKPKPIIRNLRPNQVSFPVMPGESERRLRSLTLHIEKIEPTKAKLSIAKVDTDYQVSYFFIKNSCWNLGRIEDWSL